MFLKKGGVIMFQELVKKAKADDIAAKDEIIKRLQPLIISSIKRYYYNKNEFDDLIQAGNLKILESIILYDEKKGIYFLGYIKIMLKYMYLDMHKIKRHSSLNEKTSDTDIELIDLLVSDEVDILENIVVTEQIKSLREAINCLTDRQKAIILLFYIEKNSIGEIADKLNIKYRTVVNIKTSAVKKLGMKLRI